METGNDNEIQKELEGLRSDRDSSKKAIASEHAKFAEAIKNGFGKNMVDILEHGEKPTLKEKIRNAMARFF